jgi:hypothetical protein
MKTLRFLFPLAFILLTSSLRSQFAIIPKYEIGINAGTFIYQGDLTPNALGSFNTMKPGFGIFGTRNLNSRYAIRLQLMRGWLKGDDSKYEDPAWRQQRNLKFTTPVTEISGLFVWNIAGLRPNEAGIINFTPYLFAGLGYSFLNIDRDWSQFDYGHFAGEPAVINGLNEDINHGVPGGILVFPVGAGVRYGINEKLSFTLEGSTRFTTTDYLDGFSQAANPDLKDSYHTITAGLIYSFGKRNRFACPVFKN